jgi:hypothetical protein
MGGPNLDVASSSSVISCKTCGATIYSSSEKEYPVPEICPRGKARKVSSVDCLNCLSEKELQQKFPKELDGKKCSVEALTKAQVVLSRLLADISSRFLQVWQGLSPDARMRLETEWRTCIYRALENHPYRPLEILRYFLFDFTGHPDFSDAWSGTSVTERKFIRRIWEGLIRDACVISD